MAKEIKMNRIENKYSISTITMKRNVHNLCTIGQDWFTAKLTITLIPLKYIPDYIEIDTLIDRLEGKELIIEELIDKIIKGLRAYEPEYIHVIANVEDAKHLSVCVEGSWYNE